MDTYGFELFAMDERDGLVFDFVILLLLASQFAGNVRQSYRTVVFVSKRVILAVTSDWVFLKIDFFNLVAAKASE